MMMINFQKLSLKWWQVYGHLSLRSCSEGEVANLITFVVFVGLPRT